MRKDRVFTNLRIITADGELACHKMIVAASSEFLLRMLTSDGAEITEDTAEKAEDKAAKKEKADITENKADIIKDGSEMARGKAKNAEDKVDLQHLNPEVTKLIVDYMYTGSIFFHHDQLQDLLRASHYLEIQELIDVCLAHVVDVLDYRNVIAWMKTGQELDLSQVGLLCTNVLIAKFAQVSCEPSFFNLNVEEVVKYLGDATVSGVVESDKILHAAMQWISHDPDKRKDHLERVLLQLRLENCSLHTLLETQDNFADLIAGNVNVLSSFTRAVRHVTSRQSVPGALRPLTEAKANILSVVANTAQHIALQINATHKKLQLKHKTMAKALEARPSNRQLAIVGGSICNGGQLELQVNTKCWVTNEQKEFTELDDFSIGELSGNHSICESDEGFIITGGEDSDLCAKYVIKTRTWKKLANMLKKRAFHASICKKDTLMVFGGEIEPEEKGSDSVDYLVLNKTLWEEGPSLLFAILFPKITAINNNIYVLDPDSQGFLHFDPENMEWSRRECFPGQCDRAASMSSANGQVRARDPVYRRWARERKVRGSISQRVMSKKPWSSNSS
jgi:hypothetical protein